jgi:hypothetical protein
VTRLRQACQLMPQVRWDGPLGALARLACYQCYRCEHFLAKCFANVLQWTGLKFSLLP